MIRAPAEFRLLLGNAAEVVSFVRDVGNAVLAREQRVWLDFKNTRVFSAEATIFLLAEMDRIVRLSKMEKPLTIIDPASRRAKEVLKQVGLYAITGDSTSVVPTRDDVIYWTATKGADQSGKGYSEFVMGLESKLSDEVEIGSLWRGISEVINNTTDHAYKFPRADGFDGLPDTKWWMFTQLRDGNLTVVICDLGCGYAATIQDSIPAAFLSRFFAGLSGTNRDAAAIAAAMEFGKSSTGLPNRGLGSRDALSVLERHGEGDLFVLSNSGYVRIAFAGGNETRSERVGIHANIGGTIVWWRLKLRGAPQ